MARFIALRTMTVGPGKGRVVHAGDEVPEAATWPNLRVYLKRKYVEEVLSVEPTLRSAPVPASDAISSSVPDDPETPPGAGVSSDANPALANLTEDEEDEIEEADEEEEADPALDNACPTCGVEPGDPCLTSTGNTTSPHKARG